MKKRKKELRQKGGGKGKQKESGGKVRVVLSRRVRILYTATSMLCLDRRARKVLWSALSRLGGSGKMRLVRMMTFWTRNSCLSNSGSPPGFSWLE